MKRPFIGRIGEAVSGEVFACQVHADKVAEGMARRANDAALELTAVLRWIDRYRTETPTDGLGDEAKSYWRAYLLEKRICEKSEAT